MLTRRTFLQLMAASTGVAVTGSEFLAQTAASAAPALSPNGSNGVKHVVVLMMENRSFDHFLGWLPGADGRHDLTFLSTDGNHYRNYRLAPDFQGCGYSDPDHSWEGWLVEYNFGKMDGFLQRPTALDLNPGVTAAAANTFPFPENVSRLTNSAGVGLIDLGATEGMFVAVDSHPACATVARTPCPDQTIAALSHPQPRRPRHPGRTRVEEE